MTFPTEVDMRFLMAVVAVAVLSASAHAGPFRRSVTRPTTCVGGACAKAVTTAPVRVVRKVVGR
jgi:hypothetical protein